MSYSTKPRRQICAAALLALVVAGSPVTYAAKVTLTKRGRPVAVIVHNGHTKPAPGLAPRHVRQKHIKAPAAELQAYLKQITGAELPLVKSLKEAGNRAAIVLELVKKVRGASNRDTGKQAYRIRTNGKHLVLTAATPLGLHNAVYGLLEDHLGCRFYSFRRKGLGYAGPGYEIIPKRPTLKVPAINDLQEPAFANRGLIYWVGSYPWILKNRGIGSPADQTSGALNAHHNMYSLIPPKDRKHRNEVIKGLFAEHPEFYPLNQAGKRESTWSMGICGTNAELPKFLALGLERDIKTRLERKGGKLDWSFPFSAAQGDGFTGCQCPECRKLVYQEQSEAAPLILAINRALDIVNKTYPKARVITFAYFGTIDAPKTLKPHPNLLINVVSSDKGQNAAGDQIGLIDKNPANRDYARALREWPKIAPDRVTVWNWDTYRAEWPSMFYVAAKVRYFRDCGIYGVNPQFCGGPWVDLLAWLYLRLAWDPDQDDDKLIQQYLDDNFGKKAGAHVWKYLKLAQSGYENSLYVPSAVRWSGWTPTTRQKLFPPSRLAKMTTAMDKAMAAAEKAGDSKKLANLIAARGQSLDVVNLNAATDSGKAWGPVPYRGKNWFVAGASPLVPPALMRAKKGIVMNGGGEHGILRTISGYVAGMGGPLAELTGPVMTAAVCPDLKGQITSIVDQKSRKELLAVQGAQSGYMDIFHRIHAQIWLPAKENHHVARRGNDDWSQLWSDFRNPDKNSLKTDVMLSPQFYGFYPTQYIRRTVIATGTGVRVERQFIQQKARHGLRNPTRFSTRWRLALPNPKQSKVAIKGGGIDQLLDLRYAVPGGIKGVKAGESLPGADCMDERFDTVIAVSDAKVTKLPLKADAGGNVVIQLDRGDGVAAVLATTVAGWDAVEIKPVVNNNCLEVTLIGKPLPMSLKENKIDLPVQTLSAKAVQKAKAAKKATAAKAADVKARIRKTGKNRAVNEIDGSELIWVPAGGFLRGSRWGQGGSDERPQRKVYLDGYWITKFPITVKQYKAYCVATGTEFKPPWGQGMHAKPKGDPDSYPVLANWYEAEAYAKWARGQLPAEAQWEKAARGTDGREYPWGNKWEPKRAVGLERSVNVFSAGMLPVGSSPKGASPYGVEDMAGNCWEWVADWYEHGYYRRAPARNPAGPKKGTHKVLRGGDSLWDERFSRCAARMVMPPHVKNWVKTGFRCVFPAQKKSPK